VPPTAMFPTHIIGKLKAAELRMFLSNNQLRIQITIPYKKEIGNKGYRKLLSNNGRFFVV